MTNPAAPACPQAGAAEFPNPGIAPPLPFACALGKSDGSTCHWQIAQTALWHPAFAGGAYDQRRQALPPLPAFSYALLFLAGFDTRQIRQRPPALRRPLPNLRPLGSPQPLLPFACALEQSDRSTCHWQVDQTVRWHPVFAVSAGGPRRPALGPWPPPAPYPAPPARTGSRATKSGAVSAASDSRCCPASSKFAGSSQRR